jgi:2,3-dihydroxybenzoate decarboxylase
LREGGHGLSVKSPGECAVGGLDVEAGEVEFGLYNRDWSRRLERQ